jgi:hypothetical protein
MKYQQLESSLQKQTEYAVKMASDLLTKNKSFSPFIIYGKEHNKIERLIVDSIDKAIDAAVDFIEDIDDGSEMVILCYNEKITLADGIIDAIITQIYGVDEESGYSFAHGYKIKEDEIVFLNEAIYLGSLRNCLVY